MYKFIGTIIISILLISCGNEEKVKKVKEIPKVEIGDLDLAKKDIGYKFIQSGDNKNYALINSNLEFKTDFLFKRVSRFQNNKALVEISNEKNTYALIDTSGKILQRIFSRAWPKINNGFLLSYSNDGKPELYNDNGTKINKTIYDRIEYDDFINDLLKVQKINIMYFLKDNVIDDESKKNKLIGKVYRYYKDLAQKWFPDEVKEIEDKLDDDSDLDEKLNVNKDLYKKTIEKIKKIKPLIVVSKDGKKGLIDLNGNEVLPVVYDEINYRMLEDDALLKNSIILKSKTGYGISDLEGKMIIDTVYSKITVGSFKNEYPGYYVYYYNKEKRKQLVGFFDNKGKEIIPVKYEYIYYVYDKLSDQDLECLIVKEDGKYSIIDTSFNTKLQGDYINIQYDYSYKTFFVENSDKLEGVYNVSFESVIKEDYYTIGTLKLNKQNYYLAHKDRNHSFLYGLDGKRLLPKLYKSYLYKDDLIYAEIKSRNYDIYDISNYKLLLDNIQLGRAPENIKKNFDSLFHVDKEILGL